MSTRPRTPGAPRRIFLWLAVMAAAVGSAGASSTRPNDATARVSFATVRVGQDQTIVLRVTYPPLESTGSGLPVSLRVVADFDLYVDEPGGTPEAKSLDVVRHRFLERRSLELAVLPGESVSIGLGGEMISGYSASHLSLLGPAALDLRERGITVTGELTTHLGGPTLAILKPEWLGARRR